MPAPRQVPVDVEFGRRLKRLVQERFATVVEFCAAAGVDRGAVYGYFEGKVPKEDSMQRMARALGVTAAALRGAEPEHPPTPYDREPGYRSLIAALEAVAPDDRAEIIRQASYWCARLRSADLR
jgi:transcriptional regulator with XRE-family HTH domain